MAKTNIGRALAARIETKINSLAAELATGSASNYEDYRHYVGMVAGLHEAVVILDDLEKDND